VGFVVCVVFEMCVLVYVWVLYYMCVDVWNLKCVCVVWVL